MNICKSVRESLALLKVAFSEPAMKESSVLMCHSLFEETQKYVHSGTSRPPETIKKKADATVNRV